MRINNLVIILTVLFLINLLQTKSQGNGEDSKNGTPHDSGLTKSTELIVHMKTVELFNKTTNKMIEWNENFIDHDSQDYNQLRDHFCGLLIPIFKGGVPSGSCGEECNVTFKSISNTPFDNVQMILSIIFKYNGVQQFNTEKLTQDFIDEIMALESDSTLELNRPGFIIFARTVENPTKKIQTKQPPETEDKNANKGSTWKIIAIIALVALIIVVIGISIFVFLKWHY
uniref:Egg protein CP1084 n=1 Tax=Schistosoma japonicum TaxID=6182 RepID=C7TYE9_SCHJA|nr:Egg protein CP1084 [Schistosoma japonicum]CAX82679.1 Egg protein CP1084 [Schistosoma japonicum]CAX82854.1 Egg protein CP1084 [Schistosoma japonicum]